MALSLIKLVGSGITKTNPTVNSYFHKMSAAVNGVTSFNILAANFTTDTGGAATTLVTTTDTNGYYLLYYNGALQPSGMINSVAGTGLKLSAGGATFSLMASATVTLTVTNFTPVTTFVG